MEIDETVVRRLLRIAFPDGGDMGRTKPSIESEEEMRNRYRLRLHDLRAGAIPDRRAPCSHGYIWQCAICK